jgi:ubiquinol-cytochrome c reductase cytochrome b subunit
LVEFIWGGSSVDAPTLNRFFSFHFLLPFILVALMIKHLMALHKDASNNPEGISSINDRIKFHPYCTTKDLVGVFWYILALSALVFFKPHVLGDPDNNIPANALVTPSTIVPDWYFLPFYAILRSLPNKLKGVIAMFSALIILIPLSFFHTLNIRSNRYRPLLNLFFWIFAFNFLFLMWLGAKPIAQPFTLLGQLATLLYFSYFFTLMLIG